MEETVGLFRREGSKALEREEPAPQYIVQVELGPTSRLSKPPGTSGVKGPRDGRGVEPEKVRQANRREARGMAGEARGMRGPLKRQDKRG